ncbi:hypothetical protein H0H93_008098, partial [Arthromyces matolae]
MLATLRHLTNSLLPLLARQTVPVERTFPKEEGGQNAEKPVLPGAANARADDCKPGGE